jgi:hypothetical protein
MKCVLRSSAVVFAFALAAALAAAPAHAENGEVTGADELTSSFGPKWGNGIAQLQFDANGFGAYAHDSQLQSSVRGRSWSAPRATLLGQSVTFWDLNADSLALRHRTNLAQSGGITAARIILGGTTFFDCFFLLTQEMTQCANTRSLSKTFVRGEQTFWVGGVVPVSFGGSVSGSINTSLTATARVRPYILNGVASATDTASAFVTSSGSIVGSAWATIGIQPALSASFTARVDFLRVTASGPGGDVTRQACALGGTCVANSRVSYQMNTRVSSSSLDTLGGRVTLSGCVVGFCGTDTIGSWTGVHFGNANHANNTRFERFSSLY